MKKYYLCLDETGQFELYAYYKQASFVGGYLCDEKTYGELLGSFEGVLQTLQSSAEKPMTYRDLHFREIEDKDLLHGLENWWGQFDLSLIKSKGMPLLNLHPQQAYSHALLAVICQAVDLLAESGEKTELEVWYALRGGGLLTEIEDEYFDSYQAGVRSMIQKMASQYAEKSAVNVKVKFGMASSKSKNAPPDKQLVLADLVVGTMRFNPEFVQKQKLRVLTVEVKKRIELQIKGKEALPEAVDEADPVTLLLIELERYTASNGEKKNGDRIKRLVRKDQTGSVVPVFISVLKQLYLEWRDLDGDLPALAVAAQLAVDCFAGQEARPDLLQLKEQGLYYLLHAAAHSGQGGADSFAWRNYRSFMEQYGEAVYPELLLRITTFLEALLIGVQEQYFNVLNWDWLEAELSGYAAAYRSIHQAGGVLLGSMDSLGARLNGTEGQALAFIGCRDEDRDSLELAEEYLLEDVRMLDDDNPFHVQGLSFLHSLYWWRQDIEKCNSILSQILRCPPDKRSMTAAATGLAAGRRGLFQLLDWLRYTALRGAADDDFSAETALIKEKVIPWIDALEPCYPVNLAAKWCAVVVAQSGAAVPDQLWQLMGAGVTADPLATLFAVNGRMVRRAVNGKTALSSEDEKRLTASGKEYPGVQRLLESRLDLFRGKCDPFTAARFLPYYYS